MTPLSICLLVIFILNVLSIFTMIFSERKKPQSIISWTVVLTFFPILGFLFYVLVGSGLSIETKRLLRKKRLADEQYENYVKVQKSIIMAEPNGFTSNILDFILFNINNGKSACLSNKSIKLFLNGNDKIKSLIEDIRNAKHSINLLYYIFSDDKIGKLIIDELCEKARQGIRVNLVYDSVGSIRTPRRFFKKLQIAGGTVREFFPPLFNIRLINLKLNYRNHRKFVIIDGNIAYLGGINIRDDHMGLHKRLRPWRDTHIRIEGESAINLQLAFFTDFAVASKKPSPLSFSTLQKEGYFPAITPSSEKFMQVVSSGPETENQQIKQSLIKMISFAKKRLYIETPYFVPDESFMNCLRQAKLSGVEINLLIPKIADKKIVYFSTLSFVKEALSMGVHVYLFNGFLHSKLVVVDDKIVSIGTANIDNRSFLLNFETNAFVYDYDLAKQCIKAITDDIKKSSEINLNFFKRKPFYSKMGQALFRLFSPLL